MSQFSVFDRFSREFQRNRLAVKRFLASRGVSIEFDGDVAVWLDMFDEPCGSIEIMNLQREYFGLEPV